MSSFKNSGISDKCIGNIKRDYKAYLCMYINITMSAIIRINTEGKSLIMYLRPGKVFCLFLLLFFSVRLLSVLLYELKVVVAWLGSF